MRRKLIVGLALFSMLGAGIINGQESTNLKVITMSKLANGRTSLSSSKF